ncbi:hypothetical protein Hamer_G014226, partial [Homarus americanus]
HHPPGSCLLCWVCLPEVVGGTDSKDAAVKWIANISRTWEGVTQEDLGLCSQFTDSDKFHQYCSHGIGYTACIKVFNDLWTARTCGRLPTGMKDGGCVNNGNYTVCYNLLDYSNKASSSKALPLLLLLLPTLTITY